MNITLVLHNIRSTYNVGAILRTAEGLGIQEVVYSGYTPRYNNPAVLPHLRIKLDHQIAKSALGAELTVRQSATDDLPARLAFYQRDDDTVIVGLENNLNPEEASRQIILGSNEQAALSQKADLLLILGAEVHGIPEEIRKYCDYFLEIPMQGHKESFNVSVATAIALWGLQHPAI